MKKNLLNLAVFALSVALCSGSSVSDREPVVYIAGFTDAAGSRAWENVETAVRDLLVGTVAENRNIRVVEREKLDFILREHETTGLADADASARLGKMLGADRIISGRFVIRDENLSITAHIVDVPTAVIQATCTAQGRVADLLDVVVTLASEISRALEIPFDPGPVAEIDTRPVSSLAFLRGLGFFYTGDYNRALMDFMTSGDIDPDNYERHYWMARCYLALDEHEHAGIELRNFLRANPYHTPEDVVRLLEKSEQSTPKTGQGW